MDLTASYVICATPRTGSYLLCDALAATGVAGYPTEHLSATYQQHWQQRWDAPEYADYISRVLTEGSTGNGVFGTKLHRHQLDHVLRQVTGESEVPPERAREVMEQLLSDPRWILITRRDRVAQAVSYTRSMQTDIWWDADADPAPPGRPRPAAARFDYAQIEAYRHRLLRWERRWHSWFADSGITAYEVVYEDLVSDLAGSVAGILAFLGLTIPAGFRLPTPRLRRQFDATSDRWISRVRALQSAKRQRTVGALAGLHRGEPVIVCGCGGSVAELDRTNERVTVGVNDIGRAFTPSYHVVVDNPGRIAPERWEHVRATRSDVLITNQFLDIDHPFIVRMALRETPAAQLPDLTAGFVIGKPWYSPYVAASIAGLLGADPIGLIGVDFSDDHFFGATGPYPGIKNLPVVDTQFRRLGAVLTEAGGRIANLSQRSRVTAFPKLEIADFDRLPPVIAERDQRRRRHLVVYDQDAGALGGLIARCIWAESGHCARYVHGSSGIDPLGWPDLDWTRDPAAVEAELEQADVVLTIGSVQPEHQEIVGRRARLALLPSDGPGVLLGGCAVPVPVPSWSLRCSPEERDDFVTVFLDRGDELSRSAIEDAAISAGVSIRLVDTASDQPAEVSKFRRRAHIVVDAGTTGPWLTSLAGLSTGSVVLNGLGGRATALRELRRYSGAACYPFEHVAGHRLAPTLRRVLADGSRRLTDRGTANRRWVEQNWNFAEQWRRWWLPPIATATREFGRERSDG